jgi:flagellar assembly factor FliW
MEVPTQNWTVICPVLKAQILRCIHKFCAWKAFMDGRYQPETPKTRRAIRRQCCPMPVVSTTQFGDLPYNSEDVFHFPEGIPGFEGERRFLCVERPGLRPLVFLQDIDNPKLCLLTLPIALFQPDYELKLNGEDLQVLQATQGSNQQANQQLPEDFGESLACLAVVCLHQDQTPTANLLGPVVLSKTTMRGLQAIRDDARYSALHPIPAMAKASASAEAGAVGEAGC